MGLLEALSDGRRLRRAAQPQQPASPPAAAAAHPLQQPTLEHAAPGLGLLDRLGDGRQQRRRAGVEARQAVKETQWQNTSHEQQAVCPPPGLEHRAWATPTSDSQSSAYAPATASSSEAAQPQPAHLSQPAHIASAHTDTTNTSCINAKCDKSAEATLSSCSGNDHSAGTDSTFSQANISSEAAVASSISDASAAAAHSASQSGTPAAVGAQDALLSKPPSRPEHGQGGQEMMAHCQPTEEKFSLLPPTAETHGASVEAIAPFKASTEFELSLEVGDQLVLTHANVRGYFGGQNMETKDRGWFPERCVAMAPKSRRHERAPEMAPEPAPELSDRGGKEKAPQEERGWGRYCCEQETTRLWYWNCVSEEWFFEDESAQKGWFKYRSNEDNEKSKFWWWHEATGRFFMDQPGVVATDQ